MPGLIGTWRTIFRSIARRHTLVTIDPDTDSASNARRPGKVRAIVRMAGGRLYAFFRSTGQRMQQAQASRALPWLEVIRTERRAKRRALVLLTKLLNPEQRQEFRKSGYFHVIGGNSRVRYRIRAVTIANIDVMGDDGKVKYRLCVAPAGGVPLYDVMAAQLLHLQDPIAEPRLLQQANALPALSEDSAYSRSAWIA